MGSTDAATALPYPGDDPASVALLAENIRGGRAYLVALNDGIAAARTSLHDAWRGTDADAADREVAALGTVGQAIVERLDTAAAAAVVHHDDLVRIRSAIDGLRGQWTSVSSKLDSLRTAQLFAPAWSVPATTPSSTGSSSGPPLELFGMPVLSPASRPSKRRPRSMPMSNRCPTCRPAGSRWSKNRRHRPIRASPP